MSTSSPQYYELSHQDSLTASDNGLIIKPIVRHAIIVNSSQQLQPPPEINYNDGDDDDDDEIDTNLSDGSIASEEDEILQCDGSGGGDVDEIEKFISKRQMSYPPLPRYESPITINLNNNSKEKLGILTPPLEESACNSIKSGHSSSSRSSNNIIQSTRSRHVSFGTTNITTMSNNNNNHQNINDEDSQSQQIYKESTQTTSTTMTNILTKSSGSHTIESSNIISISPSSSIGKQISNNMSPTTTTTTTGTGHIIHSIDIESNNGKDDEDDNISSEESDEEIIIGGGGRNNIPRGQIEQTIIRSNNTWESSQNILPVPDLLLEGLIANFQKIQDVDALLLFTSEFGSNLKKVKPETIFRNFKEIGDILASLCSSPHYRLTMEAFNAINSFSERLRQLNKPFKNNQFGSDEIIKSDLTNLIKQLCIISGESKSVLKSEGGATLSKLIRCAGPSLITNSIFIILNPNSKTSPRIKATSLDALTLLLLTFPRDDFQLEEVAKEVCSILLSPKRRLRLAALESLAVVAHALGPTTAMPLFRQLIEQEISNGINGIRSSTLPRRNNLGGQSSASKAVSARVSRRVLPSASNIGLVHYAMIPLPTTNRAALLKSTQYDEDKDVDLDLDEYGFLEPIMITAGKKFTVMGADILYVLRGSGGSTQLNNKSPAFETSLSNEGKFERPELGKSEHLTSREPDLRKQRHIEEDTRLEVNAYSGFASRVSPFNGPNVIQQRDFPPKFIEQDIPPPPEFRYRFSSNDLQNPDKPVTFDYPRRGSEGYTNGNVRKTTPYPTSGNDFTVMTMEHNITLPSNLNYMDSKFMNENRELSEDEDIENETGNENFDSEEVESKKSSAASSTRDSGVSSLKSAGRMLTNDSPPSTGERAEVEDLEIPYFENENYFELQQSPKSPSTNRSELVRSPTATNQISRATPTTPIRAENTEEIRKSPQYRGSTPVLPFNNYSNLEDERLFVYKLRSSTPERPVENSPPPTPRKLSGDDGAHPDFLPRNPAVVRSSPKSKLATNFKRQDEPKRASTSPMPYRRSTTASPQPNLYKSDKNGRHVESKNENVENNYQTTPDMVVDDFEDELDDITDSPSGASGNSRESTSTRIPQKTKEKCTFLKKGLSTLSDALQSPPRRVYKGSFRESNSQGRPTRISSEVFPLELKPLESPKHGLTQGLQKLSSPEWETNIDGFRLLVRLIRFNKEYLLKPQSMELHNIILGGLRQLGNLRSQVCRAACLFFKELFTHLGPHSSKTIEQDMEKITEKLLDKSMDTNKFIREDSGSALDTMVMAMPTNKCINVLDNYGTKHRNAIVRKTTARLLNIIIKKLGPDRILNEYPEKILPMLVKSLQEGNLETRTHAKSSLSFLASNPSFDTQLRRNVPLDLLRHSDKAITNLKNELKFGSTSSTHRL